MRIIALLLLGVSVGFGQSDSDWTALHLRVAGLLQHGNVAESQTLLEGSIAAARLKAENSIGVAGALNDLGTIYHDAGRLRDAERAYREALSHLNRLPGRNPGIGVLLGNLAGLLLVEGKPSESEKLYLEAERTFTSSNEIPGTELAVILCGLADVYWETRRYDESRAAAKRALDILRDSGNDPRIGTALFLLGKIAAAQHQEAEAERLTLRAIELWRASLGPQHPTYISGVVSLAMLLARKDPGEAVRLFDESIRMLETNLGPDHVFTGHTLLAYASHLQTIGRKTESKQLKRRAEAILARHSRENQLGHTRDVTAIRRFQKK